MCPMLMESDGVGKARGEVPPEQDLSAKKELSNTAAETRLMVEASEHHIRIVYI